MFAILGVSLSSVMLYAAAILLPLSIFLFCRYVRIPGWDEQIAEKTQNKLTWKKVNLVAFIASMVFSVVAAVLTDLSNMHWVAALMVVSSTTSVVYAFIQSLATDVTLRYVDRGTLLFVTITSFITSAIYFIYRSIELSSFFELGFWLVIFVISTALFLIPGFGASDGRTMSLIVAAVFPIVGINGIVFALVFFIAAVILFVVRILIKYRVHSLAYVNDISIPAVPIMLLPCLLLILLTPWGAVFPLGVLGSLIGMV